MSTLDVPGDFNFVESRLSVGGAGRAGGYFKKMRKKIWIYFPVVTDGTPGRASKTDHRP